MLKNLHNFFCFSKGTKSCLKLEKMFEVKIRNFIISDGIKNKSFVCFVFTAKKIKIGTHKSTAKKAKKIDKKLYFILRGLLRQVDTKKSNYFFKV